MITEYFQDRFGLTEKGSNNLLKGIIYTALQNISLMFPVGLYALLLYIWINPLIGGKVIDPNLGMFVLCPSVYRGGKPRPFLCQPLCHLS